VSTPRPPTRTEASPASDVTVAQACVMTVRGPVHPDLVGPTMMHEHLFIDARERWSAQDSDVPGAGELPFEARHVGLARWSSHVLRDNLALVADHDYETVRGEVAAFRAAAGPRAVLVELTTTGIHPDPTHLRRLADELDVHIVSGAGFYVCSTHPSWVEDATVDELTAFISAEVTTGRGGTDVRAGIIGEIGTSEELRPCEERVLTAAAVVSATSGLALNIHCHPGSRATTHRILDVVADAGADLTRCYLSHLDEIEDLGYLLSVAERGCVVGIDSFGQEGYFAPNWPARTDMAKATTLSELLRAGFTDQVVVAQDVCKKQHLSIYGGLGYTHVLTRVLPRMRSLGMFDAAQQEAVLVTNPRRLLTHAPNQIA